MKKKILVFTIALVFVIGSIISIGDTYSNNITAWFYDIKVSSHGNEWIFNQSPFVYNGTIYVSLDDVAKNLGRTLTLDPQNATYILSPSILDSDLMDETTLSGLQYRVDRQALEINNLQFQLAQKEAELAVLRNESSYSRSNSSDDIDDILDELEEMLEDDFDRYDDTRDLYFDRYTLSELSNGDIYVRMYGTFDRSDRAWEDRDKTDFRDFIEEICREINRDIREDIEVRVYDDDSYRVAEYFWDERDKDLERKYEY